MLTVEKMATAAISFKNRRMHAVTLLLLDFVRGRLQAHTKAGDLDDVDAQDAHR